MSRVGTLTNLAILERELGGVEYRRWKLQARLREGPPDEERTALEAERDALEARREGLLVRLEQENEKRAGSA